MYVIFEAVSHRMSLWTRSYPELFPKTCRSRGGRDRIQRGLTPPQASPGSPGAYLAQAMAAMSIAPAFPSEFSARGGEMGALRRDGAQAGSCSPLVPPEEGGGREQKADALSVLSVQHGARGAHWGSGHGHCLHGGQAAL